MGNKPKPYPRGYPERELQEEVDKLGNLNPDKAGFGPSYFSKALLGLIELQGRENKFIARLSLLIALLALVVALSQMYIGYDYHCNYTGSFEAKNQTKRCSLLIQWGVHRFYWEDKSNQTIKYE